MSLAIIVVRRFSYERWGSHTLVVGEISTLASSRVWSMCAFLLQVINIGSDHQQRTSLHFHGIFALQGNKQGNKDTEEGNSGLETLLVLVVFVGRNPLRDPCKKIGLYLNDMLVCKTT